MIVAKKNENNKEQEKNYKPTTFARDLLFIDIVRNTDIDTPKNSQEIIQELEERWKTLFPEEPFSKCGLSTIIRHIKDMNASELYNIKVCGNNRLGYYNAGEGKYFFTAAEAIVIAMALYRSPSISVEETTKILNKFRNLTDASGESYRYFLNQQIKEWKGVRRKTQRDILPIIDKIWSAIIDKKKIKFNFYKHNMNAQKKMELVKNKKGRVIEYEVSPYFLVWESDECYLIAHNPKQDLPDKHQLSHFKVSLMENVKKVLVGETAPLSFVDNYERYIMESQNIYTLDRTRSRIPRTVKNFDDVEHMVGEELTKNFSLDRYMREHIYMSSSKLDLVDVKIYFKESFMETILTRFYVKKETLLISPTGELWEGERVFRATITVQENDGLYQWLMQHSNKVIVNSPENIRQNLKKRHLEALDLLK